MVLVISVVVFLVIIFLLAYITIKKPAFGEIVIAIAVLMILASTFLYFQKDNRIEKKKQLIPVNEIELSNIQHQWAYGNYHKLTGHLKNNSEKYRLQSVELSVSFLDCPDSASNESQCQLLIKNQYKIDTRLSAQKSKNIETYILLDNIKPKQENSFLKWQITLESGSAR